MHKTSGSSALKEKLPEGGERFTLEQWRGWPEDERWELIDGTAYNMSPAPRVKHQGLAGKLYNTLHNFIDAHSQGKPCLPFIAPVDVFLPDEESTDTVVQPDIIVVCDKEKIADDGIHGVPDFIAEVLSPATAHKDLTEKKALYERAGVREYWLLNPDNGTVFCYHLQNGRYGPVTEIIDGSTASSTIFPGFSWLAHAWKKG